MARRPPRSKGPTPVESIHHQDTRFDIPTEELRAFVVSVENLHGAGTAAKPTSQQLPFAPPSTGKLAVKVINHYGDEVLKVFSI